MLPSRLRDGRLRTFARGPVASIASQATGLLQITLLLLHGGASAATDAYLYLFSLALTPTLILVVGVVYPSLLNGAGISQRSLRLIRMLAPCTSLVLVGGGLLWIGHTRGLDTSIVLIAAVVGMNAIAQSVIYLLAVAEEAAGNPFWISGIALPANILACIALVFPWGSSALATFVMVCALLAGNLLAIFWMRRLAIGAAVLANVHAGDAGGRGTLWFLGKATIGYASQVVLTTLAVLLPPASVTVLNLASKLVGAVSTAFTNAVMPLIVNVRTDSFSAARKFARRLTLIIFINGLVAGLILTQFPSIALAGAVVIAWLATSTNAAIAQRSSFRLLPASAAGSTMVAVGSIVGLAVVASFSPQFDLIVLLACYAALDGATAAILLWRLGDKYMFAVQVSLMIGLAAVSIAAVA